MEPGQTIYEGITIPEVVNKHPDFTVFSRNSSNQTHIIYANKIENKHGRIIIDPGFTKLYPQFWIRADTCNYIYNAMLWLFGYMA